VPNNRLQRTVMDKVPRHVRRRAAAEPERYMANTVLALRLLANRLGVATSRKGFPQCRS
jgi:hypothetical protein